MTDNELNAALADYCEHEGRYVIMKRGLYYRANACGYTKDLEQAWIVDRATAQRHERTGCEDPVSIRNVGPLPYATDLNASRAQVAKLTRFSRDRYTNQLLCKTVWTGQYPPSHTPSSEDIRWGIASASARQCAEALLETLDSL